jgi:hypothetical protein
MGPVYAICIHTEAEPGPPLKEITNGREARSLTSERSGISKSVILSLCWLYNCLLVVVCSVTTFSSGLNTRLEGEGFSSLATVFVAVDLELACWAYE